jgi:hypothetical protein
MFKLLQGANKQSTKTIDAETIVLRNKKEVHNVFRKIAFRDKI